MIFTFCFSLRKKNKANRFPFGFQSTLLAQIFTARTLHRQFKEGGGGDFLLLGLANQSSPIICNCVVDLSLQMCLSNLGQLFWLNFANKFWQQTNRE